MYYSFNISVIILIYCRMIDWRFLHEPLAREFGRPLPTLFTSGAIFFFFFLKTVASPARGENRLCSRPRTGDATTEKIAEKNNKLVASPVRGGYTCYFHPALTT